jgi:putative restriction endonuclease
MPKEIISWEHKSAGAWPILTRVASEHGTLSYKDLGDAIGVHHRSVRLVLDVIQKYCLDTGLPPLTAIVIGKQQRRPGSGFTAWDLDDLDTGFKLVYSKDWNAVPNPFVAFGSDETVRTLARQLVANPSSSADVYRKVRDRGIAQRIFREALLQAYDHRCAMCDLSFSDALQAAHIVPFAECTVEQRIAVSNGLLLCANHHQLFDGGWFIISSDYSIQFSDPTMADGPYSKADKAASIELHGRKIRCPKDIRLWPHLDASVSKQ